ncbi:hypothetical protein [Methylobacillus rhizosphaerae]|nr:hypothetical protein [Methylobacillus rhizosphaerae]
MSSLGLQAGGAAASGIGSFFSAKTQQSNLDTQAILAETNARLAERTAQSAINQGQKQVGALTLKAGQLKGAQRARIAANGVDLGVGSAAELQASTDIMKDIDKNTIETNAIQSAWGYRSQAINYELQANTLRSSADAISPWGAGASSLLGSAGTVASSWYQMKKSGALDGTWLG